MNKTLEDVIDAWKNDEADMYDIWDYCDAMEPTEEKLAELKDCIISYDMHILYITLYMKFKDLLTVDECLKYLKDFKCHFNYEPENIDTVMEYIESRKNAE